MVPVFMSYKHAGLTGDHCFHMSRDGREEKEGRKKKKSLDVKALVGEKPAAAVVPPTLTHK